MVEGRDDEEWRKRITATLRESPAAVLIDNLRRKLDTAALSAAITAPDTWADRLLGTSETVHLPVRCAWIATGNNPALSDEMARRAVRIRLDARVEQPHLREPKAFKHADLSGWAAAHRHELVWAALVLGRAWVAAGRPPGQRTIGSFESWARVVGGVLETAGIPGFLGNLQELYERVERGAGGVGGLRRRLVGRVRRRADAWSRTSSRSSPRATSRSPSATPRRRTAAPSRWAPRSARPRAASSPGSGSSAPARRSTPSCGASPASSRPAGESPRPETHRDSPGDSPPQTAGPDLGNAARG